MATARLLGIAALMTLASFNSGALAQAPQAQAPQAQAPQMSAKKPIVQLNAAVQENGTRAAMNPARFECVGPFPFTLTRVKGAGAPMVYDLTIEFIGAASGRELGPGKCWRERGWSFGQSLSADRKGLLIYRVDMGKCPFLESLTIENGRITKFQTKERFIGYSWFDLVANSAPQPFTVNTLFIGTQQPGVPVPYSVAVPPDVTQRDATCH